MLIIDTIYGHATDGGDAGDGNRGGPSGSNRGGGGSCTPGYWQTVNKVAPAKIINKIPYELSRLKPAESYYWIEGGDKVNSTMKKIPFTLGPHRISRLPSTVSLKYKVRVWRAGTCGGGGGGGNGGGGNGGGKGVDGGNPSSSDSSGYATDGVDAFGTGQGNMSSGGSGGSAK